MSKKPVTPFKFLPLTPKQQKEFNARIHKYKGYGNRVGIIAEQLDELFPDLQKYFPGDKPRRIALIKVFLTNKMMEDLHLKIDPTSVPKPKDKNETK